MKLIRETLGLIVMGAMLYGALLIIGEVVGAL